MAHSKALAWVLVAMLVACGSRTTDDEGTKGTQGVTPGANVDRGFDRACEAETDCVQVFSGDPCTPCDCTMDAIASYERDAYVRDYEARRDACPNKERIQCGPCALPAARCESGQCRIVK